MNTSETVKKGLQNIFGQSVGGNVIEQDNIITTKINVDGEITDLQLEMLRKVGRFKIKRSGTGISIKVATPVNSNVPEKELIKVLQD